MKRAVFVLLAAVVLAGLTGCCHDQMRGPLKDQFIVGTCAKAPETCQGCYQCSRPARPAPLAHRGPTFTPGPPVGAITYPYYTVRGPRDFLAQDPRPIGP